MQNIGQQEETIALLKILVLGNQQIEEGRTQTISDTIKAIRKRRELNPNQDSD